MTISPERSASCSKHTWPDKIQFVLFASSLVILALNCYRNSSIVFRRPIILCVASLVALPRLQNAPKFTILQNIILLYCIAMMFNEAALKFLHLQIGNMHLEVSLAFLLLMPLALHYILYKPYSTPPSQQNELGLKGSWFLLVIILLLHMLLLFIALKSVYGYGYEYNPAVLAALCLYFLVFLFVWQALHSKYYALTASLICLCFWLALSIGQVS